MVLACVLTRPAISRCASSMRRTWIQTPTFVRGMRPWRGKPLLPRSQFSTVRVTAALVSERRRARLPTGFRAAVARVKGDYDTPSRGLSEMWKDVLHDSDALVLWTLCPRRVEAWTAYRGRRCCGAWLAQSHVPPDQARAVVVSRGLGHWTSRCSLRCTSQAIAQSMAFFMDS